MDTIVIVGAGQAGVQVAASLREGRHRGRIVLIGEEPGLPYQRPPLSKAYLAGTADVAALALRAAAFYEAQSITLRPARRAIAIDRKAARLELEDGERLAYDHLVLATGSRNRTLPVPGAGLAGVRQLRSLCEADALRGALDSSPAAVVVGAGFIGLEFAAIAAARGLAVTVVEATARPMARAVSREMAALFRGIHEAAGVRFAFGAAVAGISGHGGKADGVRLADGTHIPAGLVLVGIGVVPNVELAAASGLAVEDGIVVDAMLATSDPAISAIGDCVRFPTRFAPSGAARIESVQNATEQGRAVAARLLGRPAPYDAVPWFWSDQGAGKLQIAGLAMPHDTVILQGGAQEGGASVLCFRDGALVGVESLNRPAEHMAARRLLAQAPQLDPAEARQPGFDLRIHARRVLAERKPA